MVEMIFENQTFGIKMLGRNCSLQYLNIIYQVQAVQFRAKLRQIQNEKYLRTMNYGF